MTIEEVEHLYQQSLSDYHSRSGEAKSVASAHAKTVEVVAALESRIDGLDKIAALLNTYADARQAVVQKQIESVVTAGLRTIFSEDLTFRIDNKMVGRRSEIDFVLVSQVDGKTLETSILDSRGGGVAAVAGFLLQATMVLLTPGVQPILFLDEVFAQVSVDYEEPLADFVAELVSRTDLQVVLVTHSTAFSQAADRIYRVSQTKGQTQVEEVK